ncbi:translation initiation factor IF-2 subunit gamma [Candidatus Woesearchaeota archaeon]|nr:translation initiation factor IF-2 subunit gamma [Candidatus Woesearchaeota archaeon]
MAAKKKAKKTEAKEEKQIEVLQPEINIGLVGHVDHGKTTLVKSISGKWTDTHSEEMKRGITIRLGYADSSVYKCPKCSEEPYCPTPKCPKCGEEAVFQRMISFVDAPGHESLMATMLSGATIMDGALLLIAANEKCPQPQTREHLMALEIMGIDKIVIVQNKVDVVSNEQTMKNYREIKEFIKGTKLENAPIIPVSAQHNINIGYLLEAIQEKIPTPERDLTKEPMMFVARSFDINKPGIKPADIMGGVLGGAIVQGKLNAGDTIEIRPGRVLEEANKKVHRPLRTDIVSIMTGGHKVEEAVPGGSIGVLTNLDPSIVKSDSLTGSVVGLPDKLPPVWYEFKLKTKLLERVVGTEKGEAVEPIKMGEILMLNVNSAATVGIVNQLGKDMVKCKLTLPVCADANARVTISRRIENRYRLIGVGMIVEE